MSLDSSVISLAVKKDEYLAELQQAGVTTEHFEGDWQKVWRYICRMKRDHGSIPSPDMLRQRFTWIDIGGGRHKDMPILLADLKKRHTHTMFIEAITEAVDKAGDPDDVSDVIQNLQGRLNQITYIGNGTVLRDLFSSEVSERMVEEIRLRRSGKGFGLPTGFTKLDATIGGMQRKRLITVMGRPGLGKSWLDLLFVANAVMAGGSFTLYPLEMTLEETAFRLYTLFTSRIFGVEKALKNFDLLSGRISPKKVVRFLDALENKFAGQLYVADVGSIGDPYTPERVEADQELHPTDGFWVDYIGLMRVPREYQENETSSITRLCAGLKQTAQRKDCIGGCSAQINRDALKVNAFIPRIEHIYGGDGLGQFSDQCVSINRRGKYLFYGLVKNRHGPEFGRTRVRFFVNEGYIAEDIREDDDED